MQSIAFYLQAFDQHLLMEQSSSQIDFVTGNN